MTSVSRILIVEDDFDIRDTLSQFLTFEGYEVEGAADGSAALSVLRMHGPPALVLLDLMMPVMDGWQFHAELAKEPAFSSTPVVIVSADARIDEEAARLGAAGYLKKPLQIDALLDMVRRFCGAPAL